MSTKGHRSAGNAKSARGFNRAITADTITANKLTVMNQFVAPLDSLPAKTLATNTPTVVNVSGSDPPLVNQHLVAQSSTAAIWETQTALGGAQNVLIVRKDPGGGEFSTISDAIAAVSGASATNPFLIRVFPGVYTENNPLSLPAFTSITGSVEESVIVEPQTPGADLFNLIGNSGLHFITLQGISAGFAAINLIDNQARNEIFKVVIRNSGCGINIADTVAATQPSVFSVENIELLDCALPILISQVGTQMVQVVLSNIQIINTTTITSGISVSGTLSSVAILGLDAQGPGLGTGNAVLVTNGATVNISAGTVEGWRRGIFADTTGVNPIVRISGIVFDNNTTNVDVPNVTASGFSDSFSEFSRTTIADTAAFFETFRQKQVITVAKAGGDFASIRDAVLSIVDNSASKPYVVRVAPGVYDEDTIIMKHYVAVVGSGLRQTIINCQQATGIVGLHDATFCALRMTAATPAATTYVTFDGDSVMPTGQFRIQHCSFGDALKLGTFTDSGGPSLTFINDILVDGAAPTMAQVISADGILCGISVETFRSQSFGLVPGDFWGSDYIALVTNSAGITLESCLFRRCNTAPPPVIIASGDMMRLENSGAGRITGTLAIGFVNGVNVVNDAGTPQLALSDTVFDDNTTDLRIENADVIGAVDLIGDQSKIVVSAPSTPSLTMRLLDRESSLHMHEGEFLLGSTFSRVADVEPVITRTTAVGLLDGGVLSVTGGLVVEVTDGAGYVMNATTPDHTQKLTWTGTTTTTLVGDRVNFIFINSAGTLTSALAQPDPVRNILLGSAVTNTLSILYLTGESRAAFTLATQLETWTRSAIGTVFTGGASVTINDPAALNVTVTSGQYFIGTDRFPHAAGGVLATTPASFDQWTNTSGVPTRSAAAATTIDNVSKDDGTGSLTGITAGQYVKHGMYVTVDAASVTFFHMHYATDDWATQAEAEAAALPATSFPQSFVAFAGIIVQQGNASIVSATDERPFISKAGAGASAAPTDHNSLANLTVNDPHTQYLPVDGSRAMAAALDMGTNNITNVGTVDGVDVSAHAARHLPGGADALPTAVPAAVGTANAEGVAASFSRSDHVHAHGNQTSGTLHAAASGATAGFMSAADKTKLDGCTAAATVSTLMLRDASADTALRRLLVTDTGSGNTVTFQAPVLAGSYALTMPVDDGLSSQVLTTNGSGVLSWSSAGGFSDPLTTNGDIIVRSAGVTTRLAVGTRSQMLRVGVVTGEPLWADAVEPTREVRFYDEFMGESTLPTDHNWLQTTASGGVVSQNGISGTPTALGLSGILNLNGGGNPSGVATISRALGGLRLGNGRFEASFLINLPDTLTNYVAKIGFGDTISTSTTFSNGVWFEVVSAGAVNARTAASASVTTVATGVTIVTSRWYAMRLVYTPSPAQVEFFIWDDIGTTESSVATITTNLPTANTQAFGPILHLEKTGGGGRSMLVDYFNYVYELSTRLRGP